MSIHFILGGSGSGKSTRLYQHIIDESLAHPARRHMVIAPEQSTLQTTREIVLQHPAKGILNIDVLSFNRLSYRIFEQVGAGMRPVLTETGKNLVLRRAASRIREELPWLGARLDRQGYVSEVKSVLSELAQYEITGEVLDELIGEAGEGSLLRMKLSDIRLLQQKFEEAKEGLYITAEEVPGLLARFACESELLRGAVLAFDGFTGFTPVQMTAIRSLMRCAGDLYFSFTLDEREELFGKVQEHELFALSKRTVAALAKMAAEEGVRVEAPELLAQGNGRFAPGSQLYRLERELMRSGGYAGDVHNAEWSITGENRTERPDRVQDSNRDGTAEILSGRIKSDIDTDISTDISENINANINTHLHTDTDSRSITESPYRHHLPGHQIILRSCTDPGDEAVRAAAQIIELIAVQGYTFRDIGVICADMNVYAEPLTRVFERCGIPHFIDRKEPVLLNPCLEFIRAAIEMAEKRFSYDSVMRLMRTGFSGISLEDVDLLDNYLLAAGIRSWSQWKKPWLRPVRSISDEERLHVDEIRQGFTDKMIDFMEIFSGGSGTVRDYADALAALLERFDIAGQLETEREKLLAESQTVEEPREKEQTAKEQTAKEQTAKEQTAKEQTAKERTTDVQTEESGDRKKSKAIDIATGMSISRRLRKAREYEQVYDCVQAVLEEARTLLGEERVSRKEFARILDAGFDQARIGLLPPLLDQVYVGDLLRTRLSNIKALFFLGFNDGLVPAHSAPNQLLSDLDRTFMSEHGAALSPSMKEDAYIQRFYLYLNLTRPSEKLYLSYAKSDSQGRALRPSAMLGDIRRAVPEIGEDFADSCVYARDDIRENGVQEQENEQEQAAVALTEKPQSAARIRILDEAPAEAARLLASLGGVTGLTGLTGSIEETGATGLADSARQIGERGLTGSTDLAGPAEGLGLYAASETSQISGPPDAPAQMPDARDDLSAASAELSQLVRFAREQGETGSLGMALQGAAMVCSKEKLSAGSAALLYAEDHRDSVSRMDTYASCPFAHFIRYGLRLQEREEFQITALDTGTLFHDALDRFFTRVAGDPDLDWRRMEDEQAFALVGTCLEDSMQVLSRGIFSDTQRNAYTARRVREILESSVWAMLRQIRAGSMTPTLFESSFYRDSLVGKIDRIDIKAESERVYASLVDYKSGSTGFDPRLIYDGRNLQLPIYLGEMLGLLEKKYPGREVVPAGMYYSHLDAPLLTPSLKSSNKDGQSGQSILAASEPEGKMPEWAERELLKKLRLDGITNLEPEALRAFAEDEDLRGLIVPVPQYNKTTGKLRDTSSVATTKQLTAINTYALERMRQFRKRIDGGSIEAVPYRDGAKVSCQYCPCREACSFDGRLRGARYRYRTTLGKQEALQEMERMAEG